MSSGQANRAKINFDDLNWEKEYRPIPAYAQSKLADLLMSQQLARLATERGWSLLSLSAHPGNAATNIAAAVPTMGVRPSLLFRIAWKITPQQSAEAGAEPMLFAATSPDAVQGGYYGPRCGLTGPARRQQPTPRALDPTLATGSGPRPSS